MLYDVSSCSRTFSLVIGALNDGQQQPASNFFYDSKSDAPQQTQRYVPGSVLSQYSPVKGRSVPFWRVTRYCSGVSCAFHSSSV